MKKCPQCGKQIDDGFSFCPFCGFVISNYTEQSSFSESSDSKNETNTDSSSFEEGNTRKSVSIISGVFALIIIILAVAGMLIAGSSVIFNINDFKLTHLSSVLFVILGGALFVYRLFGLDK